MAYCPFENSGRTRVELLSKPGRARPVKEVITSCQPGRSRPLAPLRELTYGPSRNPINTETILEVFMRDEIYSPPANFLEKQTKKIYHEAFAKNRLFHIEKVGYFSGRTKKAARQQLRRQGGFQFHLQIPGAVSPFPHPP